MARKRNLPYGLKLAKAASEKSTFEFKVGAALINKSIIQASWNTITTSPAVLRHGYKYPDQNHAEFRLFSHSVRLTSKVRGTIYIYRALAKEDAFGMAKPCKSCREFLKQIMHPNTSVVYTTNDGWVKEKLFEMED